MSVPGTLRRFGPLSALSVLALAVVLIYGAKLEHTPPDLHRDEVAFALQAQSIASTGHDMEGRLFPLYFHIPAFGADVWFCPMLVYVTAATLKVLPLSETTVRLPSVCLGALNVVLIFFLARAMFQSDRWAWCAAALLAMTPAHVIHSRVAFDFLYPVPFVLTWLIGLVQYLRTHRPWLLFVATSCLGIGVYSYIASVIMMPIYMALTVACLTMSGRTWRSCATALAGFVWPLLPLIPWLLLHPAVLPDTLGRYGIGGSASGAAPLNHLSAFAALHAVASSLQPARIAERLSLYWTFFDPSYLFLYGGYTRLTNTTRHVGLFLWPFLILVPLGILQLLTDRRSPTAIVVLLGFALAPVAACLAARDPYASDRELAVLPFGVLIATFGIQRLVTVRGRWGRRGVVALLAMLPLHFAFFEADYFIDYHRRAPFWFEWNHRGGIEQILALEAHESRPVFLSNSRDPVMESYWQFAALKHRRVDLLRRPRYVDGQHADVATMPVGSLILGTRNDGPLLAASASGTLKRLAEIPEPGDVPYFILLERVR